MPSVIAPDEKAVVDKALSQVTDIITLPEVTVRILELVEDPKSTANDLHEVIKRDPALSAKILKVVNSSFYGLPAQIASTNRAIVLLGLSAVKNIAIAASMARLFKGGRLGDNFDAKDVWTHSIGVAVATQALHRALGKQAGADEAFLGGLIHDLGILIEKQAFGDQLGDVIRKVETEKVNFCEAEREVLGADHQAFGAGLAARWQFPRILRVVIGHHHNVENLAADVRDLPALVHTADIMLSQMQLGFWLTAHDSELDLAIPESLGLTAEQLEEVHGEIPERLEAAQAVMGLS